MSNSPKNHTSHAQNQTPPQIGTRYSTYPEETLITYEQYIDLKNQYKAMMEETKRYNNAKDS